MGPIPKPTLNQKHPPPIPQNIPKSRSGSPKINDRPNPRPQRLASTPAPPTDPKRKEWREDCPLNAKGPARDGSSSPSRHPVPHPSPLLFSLSPRLSAWGSASTLCLSALRSTYPLALSSPLRLGESTPIRTDSGESVQSDRLNRILPASLLNLGAISPSILPDSLSNHRKSSDFTKISQIHYLYVFICQ
jgi:hypothetical protein